MNLPRKHKKIILNKTDNLFSTVGFISICENIFLNFTKQAWKFVIYFVPLQKN